MSDWQQTPTGPGPDAPHSPYPTGPPPGPFGSSGPPTPPPTTPAPPSPSSPSSPPSPPSPGRSSTWLVAFVVGAVVALAVAGGVLVVATSSDDGGGDEQADPAADAPVDDGATGPAAGDGGSGGGPVARLAIADVSASSTAPPGEEADGSSVSYGADQTVDGERSTTWRCVGDCTGQTLTIDLGGERSVTEVGLLPGYAKTDPTDGTNRYFQNRRVSSVQWTFDDGTSVQQSFDTDDAQVQGIDVEATTREITILITGTTPPGSRDFTPISEIHVYGS